MAEGKSGWTDEQVEQLLGNLLRIGVVTAAVVVLVGGVIYLVRYGSLPAGHKHFHGEPADLVSPWGIVQSALSGHSRGLVQLGLLVLIATPILRVALSVFAFARERDYTYVVLTLVVLAVLLFSLLGGLPL